MTTVVVVSRSNELDPSIRTDQYTYGEHVVEVHHIGIHGCIIYDVTRGVWITHPRDYLTPLAAQLRAFEVLSVVE